MQEYILTHQAVEDLNAIWNYTFVQWSEEQADKYYNMLLDKFNLIANNYDLGKQYEEIKNNLLGLIAGKHIIFYRKIDNRIIEITRILHSEMDFKNHI